MWIVECIENEMHILLCGNRLWLKESFSNHVRLLMRRKKIVSKLSLAIGLVIVVWISICRCKLPSIFIMRKSSTFSKFLGSDFLMEVFGRQQHMDRQLNSEKEKKKLLKRLVDQSQHTPFRFVTLIIRKPIESVCKIQNKL